MRPLSCHDDSTAPLRRTAKPPQTPMEYMHAPPKRGRVATPAVNLLSQHLLVNLLPSTARAIGRPCRYAEE